MVALGLVLLIIIKFMSLKSYLRIVRTNLNDVELSKVNAHTLVMKRANIYNMPPSNEQSEQMDNWKEEVCKYVEKYNSRLNQREVGGESNVVNIGRVLIK